MAENVCLSSPCDFSILISVRMIEENCILVKDTACIHQSVTEIICNICCFYACVFDVNTTFSLICVE